VRLRGLVDWLCDNWQREDEGIWEVRGGRRHFEQMLGYAEQTGGVRPANRVLDGWGYPAGGAHP
jgi:hypothetical protein